MKYQDYYAVMGVDRDATQDEIKRAYRKLARKYHPDVSSEPEAEARFKELGEAYEVLKDPEKRAAYDQLGSQWKSGQDFRPPPGWETAGGFGGGADAGGFHGGMGGDAAYGFSDFFEELFGRAHAGQGRPGPDPRGFDRHARIEIDVEDSFKGATRSITLQVPEVGQDGRVRTRTRQLNVRIPKGIRAGQQIRLAGQGGGSAESEGDLYLEVAFRPHERYRVDGGDLHMTLPIAPWEAALGATVRAVTPGGSVDLKVPAGSQGGKTLRLKGRGLPGKSPGDLYVELRIVMPPADTDAARSAWRELQQRFDFDPRDERETRKA